ncbi:MAG: methyltransferase domain-containing protein [Myxococcales bacterium]|nr:methyltransferase domain-containing protein [Myxococcales bacterium]
MKPVIPVARPFRPDPIQIKTEADLIGAVQAFMPARVIMTAVGADLFDALGETARTAAQVAKATGSKPRGTEILLDALVGLGLVTKQGAKYRNGPLAAECLTREGAHSRVTSIGLAARTWEGWDALPEILRRGKTAKGGTGHRHWRDDAAANRIFIRAMYEMGWTNAQLVADAVDTRGAARMVDVGGGPGHYALALLDRNPDLRATILDLPLTLDVAREIVELHGMEARVDFTASDVFKSRTLPLEAGAYDLALVSNVVHMRNDQENGALMKKLARALRPGGRIVIHEFAIDETRTQPTRSALFSVNMLAVTDGGRLYTAREMSGWLRAAGLRPKLFAKEPFLVEGLKPKTPRRR